MKIVIDGVDYAASKDERHRHALGPLRLFVRHREANAWNKINAQLKDAKAKFWATQGHPWEPAWDIRPLLVGMRFDEHSLRLYRDVGALIGEAAQFYDGPSIPESELEELVLICLEDMNEEPRRGSHRR